MIEIIHQEQTEEKVQRELPREIKQIGLLPDAGNGFMLEDTVYGRMHPHGGVEEKTAYVLLGKFENCMGRECTFVEAVIPLNEILFDRDIPVWDDHTWAYIYKQLKPEHDPFVIVGWALDIKGQLPNMTAHLEALHQRNFGGKRQILFLMDSLECEEAVYGSRNGHLYRRDGFYIYYQHRQVPEENDLWKKEEKEFYREMDVEGEEKPKPAVPVSVGEREAPADMEKTSDDNESEGIYRGLYRGRAQQDAGRQEKQERPAYAATVLLGAVVCVLGVTAYLNHEKMVDMEQTLAQMKGTRYVTEAQTADAETEETERMPSVEVETVMGNVEKQELSAEAAGTQEDVTAQQAETAQGAQGTAEPAENATANAAAGTAAGSETAGDTAAAGGQHAQTQRARRWRRRRRARHPRTGAWRHRPRVRRQLPGTHRRRMCRRQQCRPRRRCICHRDITMCRRETVLWESAGKYIRRRQCWTSSARSTALRNEMPFTPVSV